MDKTIKTVVPRCNDDKKMIKTCAAHCYGKCDKIRRGSLPIDDINRGDSWFLEKDHVSLLWTKIEKKPF
jgi:hypothetical protein